MIEHPQELESPADETTLLASVLSFTNPDLDALDRVSPEDFADPNIGEIWSSCRQVRNAGKLLSARNIRAVRDNLPIQNRLKQVEGVIVPDSKAAQAEAVVIDLARRRRLQAALRASLERLDGAETYSEALEHAHGEMARLQGTGAPRSVVWFSEAVEAWQDWINSPRESTTVVPTPWPDLNEKIAGGLHAGRSYVVGGRPGEGKSLAGANLALHAAEQGHTAAIFSVEMGKVEVTSRLLASGSRTRYSQIVRRQMDGRDQERVGEYIDTNNHMPLAIIDKPNVSVEYIAATCRSIKRQRGLDVVFVDYLQLLKETDSKATRERQVATMSRGLKILARELDCAVIIACQLNRNSANDKRPPALSDLRESGAIESDCDVALLLHHPPDQPGDVEFVVAKNRTGSTGTVRLMWAAHESRIA